MRSKGSRGPLLWPLALVAIGVIVLLNNFLLLTGFNLATLWPLLLVIAGAQILLRGDLVPSDAARTFGITRGSVESATLEISAGEIDVQVRALTREGRLIAGQFAADSRPELLVNDTHTTLRMDRAATPWTSFADWELALAPDLPWQIVASTSLGQGQFDLSNLIVHDVTIATGVGDIRLVCPREAFGPVQLRSALGNIHFVTPPGHGARIRVHGGRSFRAHANEARYEMIEPGLFIAREHDGTSPIVEVHISGTFGDAYLT